MSVIQFRLAARTDAAGKYNPNAPLEGNEDNMFVDSDLARGKLGEFNADEVVNLSEKGCLMVVADGMGGMNAGEVASDIAIKTVMEYFTPERLTDSIIRDSGSRMRYMETVVVAADEAIKKDSTSNPEHEGMGSTIIMAWLFNDEICLTWCGDSRAYLFRPGQGFKQVSKDHSYVQGLVDEGKITEVEAFDHPYGNVIMRSLGDPEKKAEPESRCFKVNQGDIFMLCSDGLSGVLRDRKTYNANGERIDTDNLEDIIAAHRDSMAECRDCLFEAARRNDWYDNVTAILCEIVKTDAASSAPSSPNAYSIGSSTVNSTHRKKYLLYVFVALIAFGLGLFLALRLLQSDPSPKEEIAATVEENDTVQVIDSTPEQPSDVIEEINKEIKEKPKPEPQKPVVKKEDPKPDTKPKPKEESGSTQEGPTNNKPETPIVPDNKEKGKADASGEHAQDLIEDQGGGLKTSGKKIDDIDRGDKEDTKTSINDNKTPEEIAYGRCLENGGSLPNCIDYLKIYNEKEKNHKTVLGVFTNLYRKEIKEEITQCKTKEELTAIEANHNTLMKQVKQNNTSLDQTVKGWLNDKRNELTKS